MRLGTAARVPLCLPSKACITPLRRRRVVCRLSPYSAYYDIQQFGLANTSLVPAEAQHDLDHIVRGAASAFGPLYFATFCALSVTLGALLYNLTNVLDEYFAIQEQMTSRQEERPLLYGVDVSRSAMFKQPRVRAAAEFAAAAHAGQTRKTGEPYVSHCIETALIVEANLPHWRQDSRHETAVIAALLHDTLDDTATTPEQITAAFGPAVSAMVVKVSKLSQVNQMLRRDKRKGVVSGDPSYWQSQWLRLKRMMFEAVVEEPLVILVKLADRLHNMRTVYALPSAKQQAVAEETLAVWCSMAASLGWHGIKSEMEDLCFAVVDQTTFCLIRQQLDKVWSSPSPPRSRRRVRSSRRQQQLQALAQQQQEMAEARAGAWEEGIGQSLRELRSLLGFSRAALVNPTSAPAQPLPPLASTSVEATLVDDTVAEQDTARATSANSASDVHTTFTVRESAKQQPCAAEQQQQQSSEPKSGQGLHLLRRFWQRSSAPPPLLPAPAEDELSEPQRATGGDWGVTDAALSLTTLLGSSKWTVGLQQQQQQGGPEQLALAGGLAGGAVAAAAAVTQQPKKATQLTPQQLQLKNVLSTVVPFDAVNLKGGPGLTWSAKQGLSVLEEAASRLYNELAVGSFSSGLQVEIQGRLKSLRSVHNKMQRKSCSVQEVYDARALRVVVDDAGGKRLADAVQCCYRLVSAVHKLWRPIHGEFDDYIANPKPSGYQALHTAVWGPGGAALEVQIKTSGMHEHAEYGGAAHWAYKEVLWGSAPAAAAAVGAVESAVNAGSSSSSSRQRFGDARSAAAAAAGSTPVTQPSLQTLPPVLFTFSDDGELLSSSELSCATSSSSSSSSKKSSIAVRRELEALTAAAAGGNSSSRDLARSLAAAAAVGGAGSSFAAAAAATATRKQATAVAVAERPAVVTTAGGVPSVPLLSRIAALSRKQQAQEPTRSSSSPAMAQTLVRPDLAASAGGSGSGSGSSSGSAGGGSSNSTPWAYQQQQQQVKPAPQVYVGQPVLRVADRLRYGVVLAVLHDDSCASSTNSSWTGPPAAGLGGLAGLGELADPLNVPAAAGGTSAWSDPAASPTSSSRVSLFCVIMSGGTNPDHPWRMPDYGFYQELLQYATAAGWVRPGQGDWHARLEEYEWCRDGRWHRRDHMGYLHPHTTLTLLEGYKQDAVEAAAAAASGFVADSPTPLMPATAAGTASTMVAGRSSAVGTGDTSNDKLQAAGHNARVVATSNQFKGWSKGLRDPKMLLASWATGGTQNSRAAAKHNSSSAASGGSKYSAAEDRGGSSGLFMQQQQQQQGRDASSSAAAASTSRTVTAGTGGVEAAGPDWAATAAKAAQLRSVIEWGVEAYGVDDNQQGGDISVVIWPGGGIEDVPRGTTAGEILREKGVLAILDASTESDSELAESGVESGMGSASSRSQEKPMKHSSSSSSGASSLQMQAPAAAAAAASSGSSSLQASPSRLVNVNNRLVSEDTVLSDGDLVILARERIKI